jgi:hypothetical protein
VGPVVDHRGEVGGLVQVLGFGVADLADVAGRIPSAHLAGERHVGVVLGEHVDAGRPLGRLDQGDALGHGPTSGRLRQHAQAPVQGADGHRGVLIEVVDQHDGVHAVLQERLDVPVGGRAQRRGGPAAPVVPLADRDQLHPGVLGEAGQGSASTQPQHTDANGPAHQPRSLEPTMRGSEPDGGMPPGQLLYADPGSRVPIGPRAA